MQRNNTGFANTRIPLYYQLENVLREKISSGAFAPGERLPTESELIKQYGISRITVRQALGTLAEEGLIERQQGRGTFVAQRKTRKHKFETVIHMTGSLDELLEMGAEMTLKTLEFNCVEADKHEAELLQVKPGTKICVIKRLRLHNNKPYSLIVNYLPEEIANRLNQETLNSGATLRTIESEFGIHLTGARQQIKAELATPYVANLLDVRVGAALLSIERTTYTDENKPIEFAYMLHRSDNFGFSVFLTRESNGKSETNGNSKKSKAEKK